jgi:sulfide:quinone oxidoreductase
VSAVEPRRRELRTAGGDLVVFDALVLALGARQRTAFARAITFGGEDTDHMYNGLLADLDEGWSKSVAFVVPPGQTWPLPIYELALMTASEVRSMGMDDVALALITPEPSPLAIFGSRGSQAVGELLAAAGIAFHPNAHPVVGDDGRVAFGIQGAHVEAERIVALPTLQGPGLPGVPCDDQGFIPVDEHGRVRGLDDVYAAGDATTFPIKQGGLACQLADVIAETLAARAGAAVVPGTFDPVLRGHLLTPHGAQTLEQPLRDGRTDDPAPRMTLWSPAHKIEGRYLSTWLAELDGGDVASPEAVEPDGIEVEVPLSNAWQQGQVAMRMQPYGPMAVR